MPDYTELFDKGLSSPRSLSQVCALVKESGSKLEPKYQLGITSGSNSSERSEEILALFKFMRFEALSQFGTDLALEVHVSVSNLEKTTVIKNALIAVYILIVLAISAVARAGVLPNNAIQGDEVITGSESQKVVYQTRVGNLLALEDGSLVLVINQQRSIFVQADFDLAPYIGSKVVISGIELEHQIAPEYGSYSVDPLPGVVSGNKVFHVFGISEVIQ